MASCRAETAAYRQCLKDAHASGCSNGSSRCISKAKTLEACRAKFRKNNNNNAITTAATSSSKVSSSSSSSSKFDGTRTLPNPKCRPLNKKVQHCLKWHQSDQSKCQTEIHNLKVCMDNEQGVIVAPTAGDKVWSDYKGN